MSTGRAGIVSMAGRMSDLGSEPISTGRAGIVSMAVR